MTIDRRSLLIAGASLPLARAAWGRARIAPTAVVTLPHGKIRGEATDGVIAFRGIPYAAPPVGALRFCQPQPPVAWEGVRDAVTFAPAPIQSDPMFGGSAAAYLGTATRSEDCLYLNVITPKMPGPHPVFVWIHGGGNDSGAASQRPASGDAFARDGIVQVTIGYRVGLLGFLELGGLLGERFRGSGNNGLKDIVAALRWVCENIHLFGGDPERVTLGGESAGAKNTLSVMAAPSAHGLFNRVIVESGGETVHRLAAADRVAALVGGLLRTDNQPMKALLSLPAADLLVLQTKLKKAYDRPFPFRAVIDGHFLPRAPLAAVEAGAADRIAMLIGTNRDESIVFLDRSRVGQPLSQSELANQDVAAVAPVFARYRAQYPALSDIALRVRFLTAAEYWHASTEIAIAQAGRRRASTFLYRFDHRAQSGPFAGFASHVAEMGYVWQSLDDPIARAMGHGPTAENRALAAEINQRWVSFVRGDRPDVADTIRWPPLDRSRAMMVFAGTPRGHVDKIDTQELMLWT